MALMAVAGLRERLHPRRPYEPPALRAGPAEESVWKRLCTGALRLVAQVDRDGRRYVVLLEAERAGRRALTPVEARIAALCGRALANKEIAYELSITETSVENHLSRALRKLGLATRTDLVRLYTQLERQGGRLERRASPVGADAPEGAVASSAPR